MLNPILSALEDDTDSALAIQRLLVSIPAIGPEGEGEGEQKKADAVKTYLAELGFPAPQEIRAPDPRVPCGYRPSLSYVIPGEDSSKTFWVLAHLDVVPPGDLAAWQSDPFELKVEGDTIYGRGVEDNHHGLVSGFLLAKALLSQKVTPPVNYGLLLVADEENGNKFGLEYIMAHHADLFGPDDMFIVPDAGDAKGEMIEIAEKSILWLKITVEGRQCHASTPQMGQNTLRAVADFIMRMDALKEQFNLNDPLFDPPTSTFEPTKKEANVGSVNIIPGLDVFYLDCRILPSYDLADVRRAIETIGQQVAAARGVRFRYEIIQNIQAPPATKADSEMIQRLIPAVQHVYANKPYLIGVGGGTLAALLREKGYQAAVWATILDTMHQPNEHALLSTMVKDALVMAHVLYG